MEKHIENILNVQSMGCLNCYCCEGKHLSQTWQIQNVSFVTRKDRLEVWKAKMNNSFIQGKDNLVQEAKFSEYVVFKVYYQSVIAWKIASYVAKEKIEKENIALEIDTGASVSILDKTCMS